jgi:hypothetical protein
MVLKVGDGVRGGEKDCWMAWDQHVIYTTKDTSCKNLQWALPPLQALSASKGSAWTLSAAKLSDNVMRLLQYGMPPLRRLRVLTAF